MLKDNMKRVLLVDEALTGVMLEDRITVPTSRTITDAGQMHVPCAFARTGQQTYTAGQLGLVDKDPKELVTVWRDEADVFDNDSMESFRSSPLTIGHPKENGKAIQVTADNAKDLQVGMLEGMPTRDEDTLTGTLIITNKEAIDTIEEGTNELSAGYMCDIEEVDGKLYQRNIRANHIAIVAKGRAGSSCRISDEADALLTDELELAKKQLENANKELVTQKALVVDLKEVADKSEIALEAMKVELNDAKAAAEEAVIERCEVIENARLIADMRDLGSKSVSEIRKLVVSDQMPDLKLDGKSDDYVNAMFDILIDASKSETPMSKLLKQADTSTLDEKEAVDPVEEARKRSIKRNSGK